MSPAHQEGAPATRSSPRRNRAGRDQIDSSGDLSYELERQFLGSFLNWPDALPLAVGIGAESFIGLHHAAVWDALVTLHSDGQPVDLVGVCRRIDSAGLSKRFSQLGGPEAYLAGLATCIDSHERVSDLVRVLRGEVSRRKLSMAATKSDGSERAKNQTAELMELFAAMQGEAFLSHDDRPMVCLTDKARKSVTLQQAVRLLCLAYYRRTGLAVVARSKDEVQNLLAAMADDGPKRRTWLRIAEHDGDLYLDLGDEEWTVIRITAHGWEPVAVSPVHFLRPASMCALPMPERGGEIGELFELVNIPDRPSQALALGWLVGAFRPGRPLPLLAVTGKQGCAKSTTVKILASIVDPKETSLRVRPKDEETVMVAAMNAWVLAYDNLSSIPDWLSDLLCCLSTGAAYTARTKYTDKGESVMKAQRPVLVTSIEDIAKRSDLLDRTVLLHLPTIDEDKRRAEEEVWTDFTAAHGRILGAVLDAVCSALRELPSVKPTKLPRMADFAKWAIAAENGLGLADGEFLTAYAENRLDSDAQALEACPLVEPLDRFMTNKLEWTGTASDLLDELEQRATKQQREHRRWPRDATRLSGELQRVAPNLRVAGFEVQQFREPDRHRRRLIQIRKEGDANGVRLQPRNQGQAQLVG